MKIFKFGGASVKNANAIKNVATILKNYPNDQIVVVVSAMAKTTNAIEKIIDFFLKKDVAYLEHIDKLANFHLEICTKLFAESENDCRAKIISQFERLKDNFASFQDNSYNFVYDQTICTGEICSSIILHHYLKSTLYADIKWLDARNLIKTDNKYKEAAVDW